MTGDTNRKDRMLVARSSHAYLTEAAVMGSLTCARFAPTREFRGVRVVNSIPFAANDKPVR